MLHILNGDATANILKQTDLPGELLPWREALACGPVPSGLSFDAWINTRAEYLAEAHEPKVDECKTSLKKQEEILRTYSKHEEVILWFEHDLFCQVNLIYLLNFFAHQQKSKTKLSLICIGAFPGIENFKGLGQLSPSQFGSLFQKRQKVTPKILELGRDAWRAFSAPDPTAIESFLKQESSALPFLRDAFKAHLVRFPSVKNGLGRIEKVALNLIDVGVDEFKPLFAMFGELEPVYGFGDSQFWDHLRCLCKIKEPLLHIHGLKDGDGILTSEQLRHATFEITQRGKAILEGEERLTQKGTVGFWLGGVHLNSESDLWRWDEQNRRIVKN